MHNSLGKYYQKKKENHKKRLVKGTKIFLKQKKSSNMVGNKKSYRK